MYIFDVSFIEALSLRQCTCLVHNALGSPQWFLGLMYQCHYFAGLHVRKLCHMHKSCRATLSWIWMPQKRPQTTSPWKVLQHLIAEFPTNKLQNQSHQLCWMHESTIYIYIYRCLQFCAHVSNCFAFFPAEPHRADLLRKQWSFVAYPPFLGRILKNARPDSFTEGSVSLEDLPWAKCLPTVKYLNRFDSGQRVGRHIRMSWWPLYKLSDLHSTAFLDDFWHVLYIISAHFMNICICLPQLVYIHNAIASNLSHAPI